MRKVYNILQNEQKTSFHLDEIVALQPANQVLADSEQQSFIYIVEENEQYSYLAFGQQTWESLIPYLEENRDPVVQIGELQLELTAFTEELHSLLYNIEGNSNYGDVFVESVENVFSNISQE